MANSQSLLLLAEGPTRAWQPQQQQETARQLKQQEGAS
jgi:hypothetical protein